ncbi:MAG: class I SAM-dependent methyltransferase [Bdellovibrionales bacterium]|nr:class I SAM-dependent methyltransferase [Bdellovibrionales bacterium]
MNKSDGFFTHYDDRGAVLYDEMTSSHPTHRLVMRPSILYHLGNVEGLSVLDLASGDGDFLLRLLASGAERAMGADLSPEIVELSTEKLAAAGFAGRSKVVVADASVASAYEGAPFDAILCNFVICYSSSLSMVEGFCRNIAINLKPGGHCVLTNSQGALLSADRELMFTKYGVEYAEIDPVHGRERFSRVYCKFPNSWGTEFHYLDTGLIEQCARAAGLVPERVPVVPTADLAASERWSRADLAELSALVPFQQWILRAPAGAGR